MARWLRHFQEVVSAASRFFAVLVLAVACRSSAPPPPPPESGREPAVEEQAPVEGGELEAARRAEEEIERVPPELAPAADQDLVVELLFAPGSATLTPEARARLDRLYESMLADSTDYHVDIQGHADATGSEAANRRLSERRAASVRRYLHQEKGVPLDNIGMVALGSSVPVADDHTSDGRRRNRRVVLVVLLAP